jgi:patatin-related protein
MTELRVDGSGKAGEDSQPDTRQAAPGANPPGQIPWPQEIRLAATVVGGVSLAVWMGGVAQEISHLLAASRQRITDSGAPVGRAAVVQDKYRALLGLLNASVQVDVLTGTSAGGINAACLGLSEAFKGSLDTLRDTWLTTGSLAMLFRDPAEQQPRSLLDGDRVLLGGLVRELGAIAKSGTAGMNSSITVLLTSTMTDGEITRYDDALGNLVRDSDHRLLFRFSGDDWKNPAVTGPLALAARSTASFPGAFELSLMPIGWTGAPVDQHPDMGDYTTAVRSHWLTDGGVLQNKPLGPALREIFERPADQDVRRLLLYIVPSADGETDAPAVDPANPPLLGAALGQVIAAVTSQTISADLQDLTSHNEAVVRTRSTRVSLAQLGIRLPEVPDGNRMVDQRLMDDYRDRRVQDDAAAIVQEATRQLDRRDAAGARWASGVAGQLLEAAKNGLAAGIPAEPPPESCGTDQLVEFRTMALEDAMSTGLELIRAGFRLDPSDGQALALNRGRAWLHWARAHTARTDRLADWVAAQPLPDTAVPLASWIETMAGKWAQLGCRGAELGESWAAVTGVLHSLNSVLRALAQAGPSVALPEDLRRDREDARNTIGVLLDWLLIPEPVPGAEVPPPLPAPTKDSRWDGPLDPDAAGRLLSLHVAVRGLLARPPSVDQPVDLVQVSADSRTLLDMGRARAADKLTGTQVHNFGAFYKFSWRANDWMWGRIDGAGWLIQCLLDPRRLRMLRDLVTAETFREQVTTVFKTIGWQPPATSDRLSEQDVATLRDQLKDELDFLGLDADLNPVPREGQPPAVIPVSMPVTSMVLARSLQVSIARDELPVVAEQAEEDIKAGADGKVSAHFRSLMAQAGSGWPEQGDQGVQEMFRACTVSAEKLSGERGSVLLTKTVVQGAAVATNAAASAGNMPAQIRPTLSFARAAGRSAWWVTKGASNLAKPWNLLAAAITALAGLVLSSKASGVVQAIGLPILAGALVFLVVSLLTLQRAWRMILTLLVVLAVACLLFAAFIPQIRTHLFTWLDTAALNWKQGKYPYWWLAISALLILPAAVTPVSAIARRFRKTAPPPPQVPGKTLTTQPDGADAAATQDTAAENTITTEHAPQQA